MLNNKNLFIKSDDRKNMSSISYKSEHLNDNEDFIYKQYKNNMPNSLRDKKDLCSSKKPENENTTYELIIPVRMKSEDKDDWIRELKITMYISYLSPSKQLITITLTDNNDPLFLYSVDIAEQEFHSLKHEQSLLIEFQAFPQKFYEMLELCNSIRDDLNKSTMGSYVCIIHSTGPGDALLIIQEITQFRQLNHLIIKVKNANDSLLKKYLSSLVKDYKIKCEGLEKDNSRLSENLDTCTINLKGFKDELATIKNGHLNEIENLKLFYHNELTEQKEKLLEENRSKIEIKEFEKSNSSQESMKKIEELNNKIEKLKNEKMELEEFKTKLELIERDLISKNNLMSTDFKNYKEEVESLRSKVLNLEKNNIFNEKQVTELSVKNELLLKQIDEKEKNIKNLNTIIENLNSHKSEMDDNIKQLKNSNNKLEDKLQASFNEINKGNDIIQKLQSDYKALKQKIKLKQQAYTSQEQLLNQKQSIIEEMNKNIVDLKRELDRKEDDLKNYKSNNDNLKLKLEESLKRIEENENVIRFLNQNINQSYMPMQKFMKKEPEVVNNFNTSNTSFGTKQPYFNSNAFQTQGSFRENNEGLVLPFTNFSGKYNNENFENTSKYNNSNFENTTKYNTIKPSTVSKNDNKYASNLLTHKYGSKSIDNAFSNDFYSHAEDEIQPVPSPDRNLFIKNLK